MKSTFTQKRTSAPDALFSLPTSKLIKQPSIQKPQLRLLKGKRLASETIQRFLTQRKYVQQMKEQDLQKLEQQMKLNVIGNIFRDQKELTERDVKKVDLHIQQIENQINQKHLSVNLEIWGSGTNRTRFLQKSKNSGNRSILGDKKSSMLSTEVEIDDVVKTREFQKKMQELNVNSIINSQDKDEIQRAKQKLLSQNYAQQNKTPAVTFTNTQKTQQQGLFLIASKPAMLKQYRHDQGEINMFKKNINNAERLLMSVQGSPHADSISELDPKRKQAIMNLCNDQDAYMNYKQGKVGFEKDKKNKNNQNDGSGASGYYFRKKKHSLEHPNELVADFDEVVDRLYSPRRVSVIPMARKSLDKTERENLVKEIKISQQLRNLDILRKLQKHANERDKFHEQLMQKYHDNNEKIPFSKEGISNIQFQNIDLVLEDTLTKLHDSGVNRSLLLKNKKETAIALLDDRNMFESDNQSQVNQNNLSGADLSLTNKASVDYQKETKTLEQFREKLMKKKRQRQIEKLRLKKQNRKSSVDDLTQLNLSPINKMNSNILVQDGSPHKHNGIINRQSSQSLTFALKAHLNDSTHKKSQIIYQDQITESILESQDEAEVQIKDQLRNAKYKYKIPALQQIKYPNYYIWGNPIHIEKGDEDQKNLALGSYFSTLQKNNFRTQSQAPLTRGNTKSYTMRDSSIIKAAKQQVVHKEEKSSPNIYTEKPHTPQFMTEPFNFKFKPSTPKFPKPTHSKQSSYASFNLKGNSQYGMDSGINFKGSPRNLQLNQNSQSQQQQMFIMNRSQQLEADLSRVKLCIQDCLRNESDEGERNLQKQLIFEEIRQDRMKELTYFLESNNYVSANQLSLFLRKKQSEHKAQKEDIQDSIVEYKLGIMDPCREAAGIEKQHNIKKNVGRKLKQNKIQYKI